MSPEAQKLISDALELPREARAFLAEKLLESLDVDDSFEISSAWRQEIAKRAASLDAGKETLLPGDQALQDARQQLKQ